MAEQQNEKKHKPLLYKVEPKEGEQVFVKSQPEVKNKQREMEVEDDTTSNKEEQIEQLKREFGVYEALAEVEREKALAYEWTQSYQKQEQQVEQPEQPIQEPQEQQPVPVQRESSPKKVMPKKRKKKKQESVTEVITRLIKSTKGAPATCEAQLFGKKTKFQVLSMRGEIVKIRIGYRIRYIKLSDISQLKVIAGD